VFFDDNHSTDAQYRSRSLDQVDLFSGQHGPSGALQGHQVRAKVQAGLQPALSERFGRKCTPTRSRLEAASGSLGLPFDHFDANKAAEHILPLLRNFQGIHNFSIETQTQYYAPLAIDVRKTPNGGVVHEDQLKAFINSAEWNLGELLALQPFSSPRRNSRNGFSRSDPSLYRLRAGP
jgi:hypothetical protein